MRGVWGSLISNFTINTLDFKIINKVIPLSKFTKLHYFQKTSPFLGENDIVLSFELTVPKAKNPTVNR